MAKLPRRYAVQYRAIPLMLDQERLIVAVDKLSRATKLRSLQALAQLTVVAVLAPKLQIIQALDRLKGDIWSQHVSERVEFFATTT
jgi:hypothetical protein